VTSGRFRRVAVEITDRAGPEALAAFLSVVVVVVVALVIVLLLLASRG
jgi:uncharacterized Tic20 family protein